MNESESKKKTQQHKNIIDKNYSSIKIQLKIYTYMPT